MRFYIIKRDGYIFGVGTGLGNTEITESEYREIQAVIRNKPEGTDIIDYRLREDLTWEPYEIEPMPDPEPTDEEYAIAGKILMGVEE